MLNKEYVFAFEDMVVMTTRHLVVMIVTKTKTRGFSLKLLFIMHMIKQKWAC